MTARRFAAENETDHLDQVIMKITIENQSNKHYLCLNRSDYTCYPDEREILLQAGLIAEVISVKKEYKDGWDPVTIFDLKISEGR